MLLLHKSLKCWHPDGHYGAILRALARLALRWSTDAMFGLIPYFPQPQTTLFGSRLQAWDVLVVTGFLVGVWIAQRTAKRLGRDPLVILDYAPWVLLGGFSVAHWVHVFFYEPQLFRDDPWVVFYIWSGLSSFGGFLGATIVTIAFFYRRKESFWSYCDPLAMGMAPAWTIARVGCFLAHDHKGKESTFFLAVNFPEGPRHDLGLYEALITLGLTVVVYLVVRRRLADGMATGALCFLYGGIRFFLDFLRDGDARYATLTPAQYGSVALSLFGLYMLLRAPKRQQASTALGNGEQEA